MAQNRGNIPRGGGYQSGAYFELDREASYRHNENLDLMTDLQMIPDNTESAKMTNYKRAYVKPSKAVSADTT